MNITTIASNLNWKTNNKGTCKALIKDLVPNSAVTFDEGYTSSTTGQMVIVSNESAPVGSMTYESNETNVVNVAPLFGIGNIQDEVEVVDGKKNTKIGSVDLGTLSWSSYWDGGGDASYPYGSTYATVSDKAAGAQNVICDRYSLDWTFGTDKSVCGHDSSGLIYVVDSAFIGMTGAQIAETLSGVIAYYELAEATESDVDPQNLELAEGNNTIAGAIFTTKYEGTNYNISLLKNSKYIYRDEEGVETLLAGSNLLTSQFVHGGKDKLINLTQWFGKDNEPTIDNFYKLYPTWKNYDIPYEKGSILNYKGTGIQTIGFNAYDHATGKAELLGGNRYQIVGAYTALSYEDVYGQAEELELDDDKIFMPTNDGTLSVTGGNATDTCVHLCWSGYKNFGEAEYKYEPFVRNVKNWPISEYFPNGMNAVGDIRDELTESSKIQRVMCRVLDGTETGISISGDCKSIYWDPSPAMKTGNNWPGACNKYSITDDDTATRIAFGQNNSRIYLWNVIAGLGYTTNAECSQWLKAQYDAGQPIIITYPLATPIITPIDQPLNLAYPVNDFGTEHSLPQNTTELITTDLKALIKYNTDYMRMNTQLSEIFPTVKSLAKQELNGDIMKKDDYAPNAGVGYANNLIDKNASGSPAEFTFRTSGGSQDITDGTAVAKKVLGTTLVLNQLVHDTNENTVDASDGVVEVTDAIASDALSLTMEGDAYVRNQLVPSTAQPKTKSSANGLIEVTDAVTANANSLIMYGDAYVRNQLVQNWNFADGTSHWQKDNNASWSISGNELTLTITPSDGSYSGLGQQPIPNSVVGHRCLLAADIYTEDSVVGRGTVNALSGAQRFGGGIALDDTYMGTWHRYSARLYDREVTHPFMIEVIQVTNPNVASTNFTAKIRNVQLIDLTQLFNGDDTKANAITTWEQLVAQYPEYREYVAYDTGTVVGLQPTVTNFGDEYAYGIIMDTTQSSVPCQRVEYHNGIITNVEAFSSMPAHDWHRCVLDDLSTRHVNYYLDPEDSTKKYNGTYNDVTSDGSASVLTGADGDVMVEMNITHWRVTENYGGAGKHLYLVSDKPFQGSEVHRFFYTSPDGGTIRKQYVGAYRVALCDATGLPLNTVEGALSQDNGTSSTRKARSISGALPWVNVSLADLRTGSTRNGGSIVNFDFHQYVYLMMMIEYATVDNQAISAGYSNGKTYAYWCWRKSGRTNYGNGTGQTLATSNTQDDDNFYGLKVNNVQLYRDAANDANGYYAWSNHASTATRYWTDSATPANGSVAYSDSNGTASSYTTTNWSTTTDANKVIQFQYRGIENPFGEVFEFEDGFQKYQATTGAKIRNNSNTSEIYDRDSSQDEEGSYAWTNSTAGTIWTASASPSNNSASYTDSAKTTSTGFTVNVTAWTYYNGEYWHTNATGDYTSTDQHSSNSPVYYKYDFAWPPVGYIRSIDPKTLMCTAVGNGASGSAWFRDYYNNDTGTGSRVSFVGGTSYYGVNDGLGYRNVGNGLGIASVVVGGRASA